MGHKGRYPLLDSPSYLKSTSDTRTWLSDIRTSSFDEMKYRQTSEECQLSGKGIAE